MNTRLFAIIYLLSALAVAGCSVELEPTSKTLIKSFARQVSAVEMVDNFELEDDELTFSGPDSVGGQAAWLVHVASAVVEAHEDENLPLRGRVQSSWYADGRLIEPTGSISHLPSEFLNAGIAQDCWGLWDAATHRWTW
jgi:hypothetical protein